MDLKEIQNLIKFVSNSGVAEVKLEMDDVKITIKTTVEGTSPEITYLQQAPVAQAAPQAAPAPVAAAPVAAPVAAVEVIGISNIVKRKFTLTVDSPAGSKTWIQRKSGKKWVTLKKVNSSSRSVVKVSKSGTYRIQIVGPSRKVISSPFKVK